MYSTKEFIEQFICKSGETVEQLAEYEWSVQRFTTRTFRTKANILAADHYDTQPHAQIVALKLTPRAKRAFLKVPTSILDEALHRGWIVQEVRFKKDGRTPASTMYRMGPGLFAYEQMQKEKEAETNRLLQEQVRDELNETASLLPNRFVDNVRLYIDEETDQFSWGKERTIKFHHFLIAFLQLKQKQSSMEFKEIGATYYRKIGGSKEFDAYKDVFIARMEQWLNTPIHELGITSQGMITPVYFSGEVTGVISRYSIGAVHATTDMAISQESFTTSARILWLVENRSVLTRMASEESFLKNTASLVLGIDGQVRGAHRKMIQQLCSSSAIEQVMVWVDYDQAGQVIARNVVDLIQALPYRIIGNEGNVFTSYEAYNDWAITTAEAEQEMTLGGVTEWMKWISK